MTFAPTLVTPALFKQVALSPGQGFERPGDVQTCLKGPASSLPSREKTAGCRIKSGMTKWVFVAK
jgi:hypothetical protein